MRATLGARRAECLADGQALERAAIERRRQRRRVAVGDLAQGADDGDRTAEEEAVHDARGGRLPRALPGALLAAGARARVQEDERTSGHVRLDGGGGQRLLLRQQQRRVRARARHQVAAVVDQVEALAQVRGDGVEGGETAADALDVRDGLEGLADRLHLLLHEAQVAPRVRADDERSRSGVEPGAGGCRQRPVHDQPLAEAVAQAPELLVVVEQLPWHPVERGADEQRPVHGVEPRAQARRHERAVEHGAARSGLVGEAGALGAAQQRVGALLQRAQRVLVERVPHLLQQRLGEIPLGHVEAKAQPARRPLDGERRHEPHAWPGGTRPARDACRGPGERRRGLRPASSRTSVVSVQRT